MRRFLLLVAVAAVGVAGGYAASSTPASPKRTEWTVHNLWTYPERTVAQELARADLVARARVESVAAPRVRVEPLAVEAQRPGFTADVEPWTDVRMRVLEVYKGPALPHITVLQGGGYVRPSAAHPGGDFVVENDPLYSVGGEHLLFLIQVPGTRSTPKDAASTR
jgi:hypothetical protein